MKTLRKVTAVLLLLTLVFALAPVSAVDSEEPVGTRITHNGLFIDTDPTGGYAGDYVVIYNPSTDTTNGATTGSLSGLIYTTVDPGWYWDSVPEEPVEASVSQPAIIDVDSKLMEVKPDDTFPEATADRANWGVGAVKSFPIYNYSPTGSTASIEFKVLYVGSHCRIWTPKNNYSNYYTLDWLSSDYARIAALEFDSKFELMKDSFGDFKDSNHDGKVNIMFYNIDDGADLGDAYTAGYFWTGDFYYNNLPMIHIDTWPGLIGQYSDGSLYSDITKCYGTLVHEFQHLINWSVTENVGGMHSWLNESFSAAAQEICYPGKALYPRIQNWQNYYYQYLDELEYPIEEFAYSPSISLHKGGSLAYWDNYENTSGLLARYADVLFFSQYLYSRAGTTAIYKRILSCCQGNSVTDSLNAITAGTGWSLNSLWRDYAITMAANDLGSGYGFRLNDGYDYDYYHSLYGIDLYNVYDLLPAVIYNNTSPAYIQGGGFIIVKPKNRVFNPPSGASSKLKYVGISFPDYLPGDVNNDEKVDTEDALLALRCALKIINLDADARWRADMDRNGKIDTTDALLILRRALGIH